ncbi:MAG: hypothetical protein V1717_00875, partial [Candidatus Micrarchaeota archaeon]
MKILYLAFLLFLLPFSQADYGQSEALFQYIPIEPVVNVTALEFDPSSVYQGSSTDVTVTLTNNGGTAATVSVNVSLYGPAPGTGFVENVSFDPVLVPSLTLVQITKSYSTAGRSVGNYTANATAHWTYLATDYSSNTYTNWFTVVSPLPSPTTPAGGGGGGDVYVSIPRPTVIPPELKPKPGGGVEFSKTTILKEMVAGSTVIETLALKNQEAIQKEISITVFDSPPWLDFKKKTLILQPNEETPLNLRIDVPKDAIAGDYVARIDVKSPTGVYTEFMAIRVKAGVARPIVTKTVSIDRNNGVTIVKIQVENPTGELVPKIIVEEEVPKALAEDDKKISFLDKPAEITGFAPLRMSWQFSDLLPRETATISYEIKTLLGEYSTYAYWPVKQVVIPQEVTFEQLVRLVELFVPVFGLGEEKKVTARVYYTGLEQLDITAGFELPQGFDVEPETISRILLPAAFSNFEFNVKPPAESPGTYIGTFTIQAKEGRIERTTSLILASATKPSSDYAAYIAGGIALLVLLAIFVVLGKSGGGGGGEKPFSTEGMPERETYLKEVKGLL